MVFPLSFIFTRELGTACWGAEGSVLLSALFLPLHNLKCCVPNDMGSTRREVSSLLKMELKQLKVRDDRGRIILAWKKSWICHQLSALTRQDLSLKGLRPIMAQVGESHCKGKSKWNIWSALNPPKIPHVFYSCWFFPSNQSAAVLVLYLVHRISAILCIHWQLGTDQSVHLGQYCQHRLAEAFQGLG